LNFLRVLLSLTPLLVPLWIIAYPRPYGLAIGIGVAVPLVSFLRSRFNEYWSGLSRSKPTETDMFWAIASAVLICALGVRAALEVELIDWDILLIAAFSSAYVLALRAGAWRLPWDAQLLVVLAFSLYPASVMVLVNSHLDSSEPMYVPGQVTYVKPTIRKTRGYMLHTSWMGPRKVKFGWFEKEDFTVGDPVCTVVHPGRLGFSWYEIHFQACSDVA
jgi:hypothetical protein